MISPPAKINNNSLNLKDKISSVICLFGLIYVGFNEPRVMTVFAFTTITTVALLSLADLVSYRLFNWKLKLKKWHFLAVALGITLCLTGFEAPSHAVLFEAVEEAMTDVLTATGDTVDEEVITGLFTFFRIVVILAFVGGAILAIVQALQGSDWRPIANMMGIGVGVVLSIEVLSNLILGGA